MSAAGASTKGAVRLEQLAIAYGKDRVVHGITLDIRAGEFICLLGPSGCGKTTTLRAIAGLAGVDAGSISIDGKLANLLPAHERGIGMVFQDLALFPHMSVFQNVAFGLALRRVDSAAIILRVREILKLLHLSGFEDRLPRQLSGGQQQRVALARSLVVNPSVLLLDEPFAALDRKLREEMRREIRSLQQQLGITAVFVTHDQEEALMMADRVVVMNAGVIEQVGTPSEVYENPSNRFVLDFVGYSNFLRVQALDEQGAYPRCAIGGVSCALGTRAIGGGEGGAVELAIRPERIRLGTGGGGNEGINRLPGTIRAVAYEGAMLTYDIVLADGQPLLAREPNAGAAEMASRRPGDSIDVAWSPADAVLIR